MDAVCSAETFEPTYQTTRYDNPEERDINHMRFVDQFVVLTLHVAYRSSFPRT
jgi:hypothetical protein